MTTEDEYEGGASPARPRSRRFAAGAVGLAVLLGGGAYLVTTQLTGPTRTETREPGAIAPLAPITAQSATTPAAPTTSATASASAPEPTKTAKPSITPTVSDKVRKEIQRARELAAKDGHPLRSGLTAAADPGTGTSSRTEPLPGGNIRITTAKHDLSGYPDRLLAADDGTRTGDALCTNKIRFAQGAGPRNIPSLLLCWRTSASRSVVTVAVATTGKPSAASSVAVIDREWAKLG